MSGKSRIAMLVALLTASAAAQSASPAQQNIDIITLRAETQKLEQEMYTVFNQLNSTDDFDVTCLEKAPTGSTIPVWQCEAAFMKDARSKALSGRWDNPSSRSTNTQRGFIPQSGGQISFNNRKKTQALNDELMTLARQHPQLATAMLTLHAKRLQLEELDK
jgi:hypothetical protein